MASTSPVVFVHGLFGSLNDPAIFRELESTPCSAPDLDGYGALADNPVTLEGQVRTLRDHIRVTHPASRVHLVAHSIGAVYALSLAHRFPDIVESITSVEGNFTLSDAFWSRSIACLPREQARDTIDARLNDPFGFLASDSIPTTAENVAKARAALDYQPWRTVWESAQAIVAATSTDEYATMVRRVFDQHPVHLVAGERSERNWNVPDWARRTAASSTVLPGVGHMMMMEQPASFGSALRALLRHTVGGARH